MISIYFIEMMRTLPYLLIFQIWMVVLSIFLSVLQVKAAYFDRVNLSANGFYKWVSRGFAESIDK